MSSVQSGSSRQPARRFVSSGPFHRDIFSYTYVTSPYPEGTLAADIPGANVRTCPAGRVLRESGKKLYPIVNPGVSTYMIGVIDTQSGISGFIDPNSPLFAVYSTDLPAVMKDGRDPGPQGRKDVGPPLYTNGNMYVAEDGVVDGTLTVNILDANEAMIETGRFSTMSGVVLEAEDATVSSLMGGNLSVSSTESQYVLASTLESGHAQAVTGRFEQLSISTFAAVAGAVTSELYVNQLSSANIYSDYITTQHLDAGVTLMVDNLVVRSIEAASTIAVSTLLVQSIEVASTIVTSSFGALYAELADAEISTLHAGAIGVSTLAVYDLEIANRLGAFEVGFSTLHANTAIISSLDVSTLTADEIEVSTLNANEIEVDELNVSTIEFSTMSGDSIEVDELNVSTIEFSTMSGDSIEVDELNVSTIEFSTMSGDSIEVDELNVSTIEFSTMSGDSIEVDELDADEITVSTLNAENIEVSTLNGEEINVSSINAGNGNIEFLTIVGLHGGNAVMSTIEVNDLYASTIEVSTLQANIIGVSSLAVFDLEIANGLIGYEVAISTLYSQTAHVSTLNVSSVYSRSIEVDDLNECRNIDRLNYYFCWCHYFK
jgi:hypothetical protein